MVGLAHRVVGVVQDVEKDLLQLVRVADDVGHALVEPLDNLHAVAGEIVGAQREGAAHDHIQLHQVALRRHLPREAQQVLHNLLGALRFLQDDAQIFLGVRRDLGAFQQQVGKARAPR